MPYSVLEPITCLCQLKLAIMTRSCIFIFNTEVTNELEYADLRCTFHLIGKHNCLHYKITEDDSLLGIHLQNLYSY